MTRYDPERHRRRSIRLQGYDYTQPGAYFVTICTHNRAALFGRVVDGDTVLNECGRIVWECWREIPDHFPHVALDAFVAMPNHVHGIIWIVDDVGATHASPLPDDGPRGPTSGSLGAVVGSFKSAVTRRINARRGTPGAPVWQRNYYEHIIRNEGALHAIRRYIIENPVRWRLDRYNPHATGQDLQARALWRMLQDDATNHPGRGEAMPRPYDHAHGHPGTGDRPVAPDDHAHQEDHP